MTGYSRCDGMGFTRFQCKRGLPLWILASIHITLTGH